MSLAPPILRVNRLCVLREVPLLDAVDWRVGAGEHWVILGANGSGKTSLLNALTGYLTPSSGEVEILGEAYGRSDWREVRKKIGLVSSSLQALIQPHETVLNAVVSGKEAVVNYWGRPGADDLGRAREILREVRCETFEDRTWEYLSQGEKQRVLIGRALMARHRVLILDEPCAGLDLVAREKFLNFLSRLARLKEAPTLVLVTHHVEEILPVFSHVLLLKGGKVLASGETSLLSSPLLSEAFGATVRLEKVRGRFRAVVEPAGPDPF